METVVKFLRDCGTFYLATLEGDQPRVRPFGAVSVYEGKLYICTNRTKKVSEQLKANPKFEISGTLGGSEWIRIWGSAVLDDRREAREAMLGQNPGLRNMYGADDGIFEVFYLEDARAEIFSFAGRHDSFRL